MFLGFLKSDILKKFWLPCTAFCAIRPSVLLHQVNKYYSLQEECDIGGLNSSQVFSH